MRRSFNSYEVSKIRMEKNEVFFCPKHLFTMEDIKDGGRMLRYRAHEVRGDEGKRTVNWRKRLCGGERSRLMCVKSLGERRQKAVPLPLPLACCLGSLRRRRRKKR